MAIQYVATPSSVVKTIRVLVIDSNPLTSLGIRSLIESLPGRFYIETIECSIEGIRRAYSLLPHYILFDEQYYSLDASKQISELESAIKALRVILIGNTMSTCMLSDNKKGTARGYLYKIDLPQELERCMEDLSEGKSYFSQSFEKSFHSYQKATQLFFQKYPGLKELSNREKEVIKQLLQKKSSQEIADCLFTSVRTISNHRYRIRKKLDLQPGQDLLPFLIENVVYFRCIIDENRVPPMDLTL
ncbi:MAG: response regulator transcription factor [Bacteroidia bacterium]